MQEGKHYLKEIYDQEQADLKDFRHQLERQAQEENLKLMSLKKSRNHSSYEPDEQYISVNRSKRSQDYEQKVIKENQNHIDQLDVFIKQSPDIKSKKQKHYPNQYYDPNVVHDNISIRKDINDYSYYENQQNLYVRSLERKIQNQQFEKMEKQLKNYMDMQQNYIDYELKKNQDSIDYSVKKISHDMLNNNKYFLDQVEKKINKSIALNKYEQINRQLFKDYSYMQRSSSYHGMPQLNHELNSKSTFVRQQRLYPISERNIEDESLCEVKQILLKNTQRLDNLEIY